MISQVPSLLSVTTLLRTVQIDVSLEAKLTVRPLSEVASSCTNVSSSVASSGCVKSMTCSTFVTSKVKVIGSAAANFALPVCVAVSSQVPGPRSVAIEPATVQTVRSDDVSFTGRLLSEETSSGSVGNSSVWSSGCSNEMVWVTFDTSKLTGTLSAAE